MSNEKSYYFGVVIGGILGILITLVLIYDQTINGNLLLPEKNYSCVDAEPVNEDPSKVACTVFLKKDSTIYQQYLNSTR